MGASVGGGKKGKFDLGQNSDINVTPFVDVMLVLLIIFMVAAPLPTVSIKVEIPPPVPPPPDQPKKDPIFINIQSGGHLFLASQPTDMGRLVQDVSYKFTQQGSTNPTNERVMIRADRDVPYRTFMDVLNTLQGGGYTKIGLISEDL